MPADDQEQLLALMIIICQIVVLIIATLYIINPHESLSATIFIIFLFIFFASGLYMTFISKTMIYIIFNIIMFTVTINLIIISFTQPFPRSFG